MTILTADAGSGHGPPQALRGGTGVAVVTGLDGSAGDNGRVVCVGQGAVDGFLVVACMARER